MALCRRTTAFTRTRLLFCSAACLLAFLPERLRGCAAAAFPATATSTESGSVVFGSRGGEGVRAPSPLDSDEDATLLSISEEVLDETAVELAQVLPVEVLVKGELEGVDEFVIPRAGRAKLVRFGIANCHGFCFATMDKKFRPSNAWDGS